MLAKAGELKRAAQELGAASTALRQQGWQTASPERIQAVKAKPPEWLIEARERRRQNKARQRRLGDRKNTAARLGVQVRAVQERDIKPSEAESLLAAPPAWLIAEQARRQAQVEREVNGRLRRNLTDALVTSVHDARFEELKRAISDEEIDAIDARWAPEVDRAKGEAQQLVDELTPKPVRARIEREHDAAREAGVYRASQLARRAFGGQHG